MRRAERRGAIATEKLGAGALGPERPGLLIANYGANLLIEADGRLVRCVARQHLGALVGGDRVVWQQTGASDEGVVVAVAPRKTILTRPDFSGELRPVAANIDQLFVVTAPRPGIQPVLIDRYLVAAETLGITPLIVVNKYDLVQGEDKNVLDAMLGIYSRIGYTLLFASTKTAHGLDAVIEQLRGKTSVLVGQSGVGKSSLIKALIPDCDVRVGELSAATGLGRHTTTATMLYHLPQGGDLIDSPGVREFGLWQLSPTAVAQGFVEFRAYLGHCRFGDCSHTAEPGCALRAALQRGEISPARFESYRQIVASLDND